MRFDGPAIPGYFKMRSLRLPFLSAFGLAFGFCVPASANDTLVTLGAGGLVPYQSSDISMIFEDLEISVPRISIKYVFQNNGDQDVNALVAFPLPALNGGDLYHEPIKLPEEENSNFVDFKISEDGKEIPVKSEVRAVKDKKDVTSHLLAFGLSPSVLYKPLNVKLRKMPADERAQLEKEELVVSEEDTRPQQGSSNQDWWANWSMRVQFYWTQLFPADKTVELAQTYRPVVGGGYIPRGNDGAANIKPYCGSSEALAKIKELQSKNPGADPSLFERNIQYILTTAKNWKGPIQNFHLTIDADSPDDIVLTCFRA